MRVYKVVRRLKNNWLVSVMVNRRGLMVNYRPSIATKPRLENSLLFAFRTLEEAKGFAVRSDEIWLADAVPSKKAVPNPGSFPDVKEAWAGSLSYHNRSKWISGTVFCEEITLLEKVE